MDYESLSITCHCLYLFRLNVVCLLQKGFLSMNIKFVNDLLWDYIFPSLSSKKVLHIHLILSLPKHFQPKFPKTKPQVTIRACRPPAYILEYHLYIFFKHWKIIWIYWLLLQVAVLAQLSHPNIVTYRESFEGTHI